MAELKVMRGDVTQLEVDAIVNAAKMCWAAAAWMARFIARPDPSCSPRVVRCKDARRAMPRRRRIPSSGEMGLSWSKGRCGMAAVAARRRSLRVYRRALELARQHGAKTIAFPAISTGIYGYPSRPAAEIAVRVCREMADACGVERVEYCCFDEGTAEIYERLLFES